MSVGLRQSLKQIIGMHGPIPVASYMQQSLTHPTEGYYSTRDPLGAKGDFITSPEISQMFGELVGINIVTQWLALGRPAHIRLVELGPGRGTLMSDLLRASRSFPPFYKSIAELELVESSPALRAKQKTVLAGHGAIRLEWRDMAKELKRDGMPTFIVAHEFFDALPIHQFEKSEDGSWLERLVDYSAEKDKFQLIVGPKSPLLSATIASQPRFGALPAHSSIEVCPEAWDVADQLADVLKANTGGALVMDYGPMATIPVNTLRGFKDHRQVNAFEVDPGEADLTADVDFRALGDIFRKKRLHVHGPVTQADWLHRMGIGARATMLANNQSTNDGKERIASSYKRLTDPLNMGKTYKVMAISTQAEPVEGFS